MFGDISTRGHIGAGPIFKFGKSVLLPHFQTGCFVRRRVSRGAISSGLRINE
jgi:hypothetical protein